MSDDDDTELTEDELAGIRHAWRELIEDRAHGGKVHYQMPAVRGMAPPGSFRLPRDVVNKLGDGDPKAGGAVIHQMFGVEDDPDDPTIVHGDVVRLLGNGSLAAGRRVLEDSSPESAGNPVKSSLSTIRARWETDTTVLG